MFTFLQCSRAHPGLNWRTAPIWGDQSKRGVPPDHSHKPEASQVAHRREAGNSQWCAKLPLTGDVVERDSAVGKAHLEKEETREAVTKIWLRSTKLWPVEVNYWGASGHGLVKGKRRTSVFICLGKSTSAANKVSIDSYIQRQISSCFRKFCIEYDVNSHRFCHKYMEY